MPHCRERRICWRGVGVVLLDGEVVLGRFEMVRWVVLNRSIPTPEDAHNCRHFNVVRAPVTKWVRYGRIHELWHPPATAPSPVPQLPRRAPINLGAP